MMLTNLVNQCDIYNRSKYARKKPYVPIMLTPSKPFQVIHINIFLFERRDYLTLVDAFTKCAQAIFIPRQTAIHTSKALVKYFSSFGIPGNIIVDNGSNFNNEVIKDMLKLQKIGPFYHTVISTIIEHLK